MVVPSAAIYGRDGVLLLKALRGGGSEALDAAADAAGDAASPEVNVGRALPKKRRRAAVVGDSSEDESTRHAQPTTRRVPVSDEDMSEEDNANSAVPSLPLSGFHEPFAT